MSVITNIIILAASNTAIQYKYSNSWYVAVGFGLAILVGHIGMLYMYLRDRQRLY